MAIVDEIRRLGLDGCQVNEAVDEIQAGLIPATATATSPEALAAR